MGLFGSILGPALAATGALIPGASPWLIGAGLMQTKKSLIDDPRKLEEARRKHELQKSLIANSPWIDGAMNMASGINTDPGYSDALGGMVQGAVIGNSIGNGIADIAAKNAASSGSPQLASDNAAQNIASNDAALAMGKVPGTPQNLIYGSASTMQRAPTDLDILDYANQNQSYLQVPGISGWLIK